MLLPHFFSALSCDSTPCLIITCKLIMKFENLMSVLVKITVLVLVFCDGDGEVCLSGQEIGWKILLGSQSHHFTLTCPEASADFTAVILHEIFKCYKELDCSTIVKFNERSDLVSCLVRTIMNC